MRDPIPTTKKMEVNLRMTLSELAAELELKETYLRSHWALVVRRYESYGLTLMKRGRGKTADFGVKGYNDKEVRWEHKEGSIF